MKDRFVGQMFDIEHSGFPLLRIGRTVQDCSSSLINEIMSAEKAATPLVQEWPRSSLEKQSGSAEIGSLQTAVRTLNYPWHHPWSQPWFAACPKTPVPEAGQNWWHSCIHGNCWRLHSISQHQGNHKDWKDQAEPAELGLLRINLCCGRFCRM